MKTLTTFHRILFLSGILLLLNCPSYGQKLKHFKKLANKHYQDEQFVAALPIYLKIAESEPNDPTNNYKIGVCYLFSQAKHKALPYFEKVQEHKKRNEHPYIDYYIAMAYQFNHNFDKAIEAYSRYKDNFDQKDAYDRKVISLIDKHLENCKTGQALAKTPVKCTIEHLGPEVNSKYSDTYPLISHDESRLFFSSSKKEDSNAGLGTDMISEYFDKIYVSEKLEGKWGKPTLVDLKTVNKGAPLSLSKDNKRLYFFSSQPNKSTDLYFADASGGNIFSAASLLASNTNSLSWETGASISDDAKTLFFASDRSGGYGGLDLYKTQLQGDGTWGAPVNLGPEINTVDNEDSPYISSDNTTLFFSADGPKSIGGFDIFRSVIKNNVWSAPTNLGMPINTADNEMHISWSSDCQRGYYSTYREDTYGEHDIYVVHLDEPLFEKPVAIQAETNQPVVANEPVVANQPLASQPVTNQPVAEVLKETMVTAPMVGTTLEEKIYFAFNISKDYAEFSRAEMEKVLLHLRTYPELNLEIQGYTDKKGTPEINKLFSERRAKTVYDFLVKEGIDKKRLKMKGLADANLVVDGTTDLENAKNRRVEFKVIEKK